MNSSTKNLLKTLLAIMMTLVVMVVIYTGPSFYRAIKYNFGSEVKADEEASDLLSDLTFSVDNNSASTNKSQTSSSDLKAEFKDNWFYYPKLGIESPIIWDISIEQIEERLLGGIVHLDQTAKPGQFGDIIVSGHSSFYPWIESDYKETFAVLPEAEIGDQITIRRSNLFIYEIEKKEIIDSTKYLEYQSGGKSFGKLMVMTCYPIGTNINRLLVTAKFIKEIELQ